MNRLILAFVLFAALIATPFAAPLYAALRHSALGALPLLALPKGLQLIADFRAGALARCPGMFDRTIEFLSG